MNELPWLDPNIIGFPPADQALKEPNGLLAAGGSLDPQWLIAAYSHGIFPWFNEGEPILWWSPEPRAIIYIDQLHTSKSLSKALKKSSYTISFDQAFCDVLDKCAEPRNDTNNDSTWITRKMATAYNKLHQLGIAHSVEVWDDGELVGGLYGVALGRLFFGESMFTRKPNCSKIALFYLVQQLKEWHYIAIDCQVYSDHLASMGATKVPRNTFTELLNKHVHNINCHWQNNNKRG